MFGFAIFVNSSHEEDFVKPFILQGEEKDNQSFSSGVEQNLF